MEFSTGTATMWTDREWLTFLLLLAAEADGIRDAHEMRMLRVEMGKETVNRMVDICESHSREEKEEILQQTLPERLPTPEMRMQVQKLLRKMVMADGDYSTEEQQLIKRISDYLRMGDVENGLPTAD